MYRKLRLIAIYALIIFWGKNEQDEEDQEQKIRTIARSIAKFVSKDREEVEEPIFQYCLYWLDKIVLVLYSLIVVIIGLFIFAGVEAMIWTTRRILTLRRKTDPILLIAIYTAIGFFTRHFVYYEQDDEEEDGDDEIEKREVKLHSYILFVVLSGFILFAVAQAMLSSMNKYVNKYAKYVVLKMLKKMKKVIGECARSAIFLQMYSLTRRIRTVLRKRDLFIVVAIYAGLVHFTRHFVYSEPDEEDEDNEEIEYSKIELPAYILFVVLGGFILLAVVQATLSFMHKYVEVVLVMLEKSIKIIGDLNFIPYLVSPAFLTFILLFFFISLPVLNSLHAITPDGGTASPQFDDQVNRQQLDQSSQSE